MSIWPVTPTIISRVIWLIVSERVQTTRVLPVHIVLIHHEIVWAKQIKPSLIDISTSQHSISSHSKARGIVTTSDSTETALPFHEEIHALLRLTALSLYAFLVKRLRIMRVLLSVSSVASLTNRSLGYRGLTRSLQLLLLLLKGQSSRSLLRRHCIRFHELYIWLYHRDLVCKTTKSDWLYLAIQN